MPANVVHTATGPSVKTDESSEQAAAASYIATFATELGLIARRHRLDTLSYLLDMAKLEAENATRHVNGRR